jgi:hypothetical protein
LRQADVDKEGDGGDANSDDDDVTLCGETSEESRYDEVWPKLARLITV